MIALREAWGPKGYFGSRVIITERHPQVKAFCLSLRVGAELRLRDAPIFLSKDLSFPAC
jgi:hypothetical protein